jgi:alpha-glucosidase
MKRILVSLLGMLLLHAAQGQEILAQSRASVQSPDKKLQLDFYQKRLPDGKREMYYSVRYKDKPVIRDSLLDLQLDNHLSESAMALRIDRHEKWFENLTVTSISHASGDTRWRPVTVKSPRSRTTSIP